MKAETKRIALWDNVKFILMLLVVLGHFAGVYTDRSDVYRSVFLFIFSFHMPLFIFISGLFHRDRDIVRKMTGYLGIYVALKIALLFVGLLLGNQPEFTLLSEKGVPWFAFALAVYIGLTYLLRNVDKRYALAVCLLTAMAAGFDKSVGDFLMLSRIIVFYPFYLLGSMVDPEGVHRFAKRKVVKAAGWVVLAVWAASCFARLDDVYFLRHLFTGRNPFDDTVGVWGPAYRALCYVISAAVGLALIAVTPEEPTRVITTFGGRTLQIYFWHNIVRLVLTSLKISDAILSVPGWGELLWLLSGVAVTFLCALKPFRYPTDALMPRRGALRTGEICPKGK